jgi:RNA polymerase sigma-70 factor (ECF subfamily)
LRTSDWKVFPDKQLRQALSGTTARLAEYCNKVGGENLYILRDASLCPLEGPDLAKPADDRVARFLQHLEPLKAALETYSRRSVYDPNSVEDVLQEAIGKAYRDFHLYAEGTNFRAWIFRYLNLEIYAGNRSFHRERREALQEEPTVEDAWEHAIEEPLLEQILEEPERILSQCDDALARAIGELSPLERSALLLHFIGQFKHREMAEVLEVPMGTIMSALSRARARLRLKLAEYGREHGLLNPKSTQNPK